MNWFEAQTLMETSRDKSKGKPIGNNTRLYFYDAGIGHESYYNIRLHGNQIMQIYRDRIVPMDGGWQSVTTKERLNRYIPRGFHVYQSNWQWYISTPSSIQYKFEDVYWIHNDGRVMLYSTHPEYPDGVETLFPPYAEVKE